MKRSSLTVMLGLTVFSTSAFAKMTRELSFVPGEVLVKVKDGQVGKFLAKKAFYNAEVKKELKLLSGNYFLLKTHAKSTISLMSDLASLPEVSYAEPNYIYRPINLVQTLQSMIAKKVYENSSSLSPQDPLYEKLWGLKNTGLNEPDRSGGSSTTSGVEGSDIAAELSWDITRGSRDVVVAVIDTGIDYNHPDLKNNIWTNEKEIPENGIDDDGNGYIDDIHGWNAITKTGNPMDGNSHGTHCAGTIGAEHDNGIGVAGVMPEVSIMAIKFLSDEGSGTLADAVDAINYATKMNVDVMSNSWGGGGFSQALEDSIKAANDKGIVFVAAAGNSSSNNDTSPAYPASYRVDNVISVASHTAQDSLSSFSSFGKSTVHVAAPGSNILSSTPNNQYKVFSGTSMATPHVSGVVGLLISHMGRLPVMDLKDRLMATTTPISSYRKTISKGRVNAYNFLTNTRPAREEAPDESAWKVEPLSEVFETAHPYTDQLKMSKTYSFPGAKYIKLVIEKYDTESDYDFLVIKDAKGAVIERISGSGVNVETDYISADSFTIEFSSDDSQTRWGVFIKDAKVIY